MQKRKIAIMEFAEGIMEFADINSAVNRWQVTTSMKTQIINSVLEITEIKNYKTETKEFNQTRIERGLRDYQTLTNMVNSTINLFLSAVNQNALFNFFMTEVPII